VLYLAIQSPLDLVPTEVETTLTELVLEDDREIP
jgi:hypothetical protein